MMFYPSQNFLGPTNPKAETEVSFKRPDRSIPVYIADHEGRYMAPESNVWRHECEGLCRRNAEIYGKVIQSRLATTKTKETRRMLFPVSRRGSFVDGASKAKMAGKQPEMFNIFDRQTDRNCGSGRFAYAAVSGDESSPIRAFFIWNREVGIVEGIFSVSFSVASGRQTTINFQSETSTLPPQGFNGSPWEQMSKVLTR